MIALGLEAMQVVAGHRVSGGGELSAVNKSTSHRAVKYCRRWRGWINGGALGRGWSRQDDWALFLLLVICDLACTRPHRSVESYRGGSGQIASGFINEFDARECEKTIQPVALPHLTFDGD